MAEALLSRSRRESRTTAALCARRPAQRLALRQAHAWHGQLRRNHRRLVSHLARKARLPRKTTAAQLRCVPATHAHNRPAAALLIGRASVLAILLFWPCQLTAKSESDTPS